MRFDDGWEAWRNIMPGARRSIMVTGTCEVPTTGYTLTLRPSEPQGINPRVLELDLTALEPTGAASDVITHERATYFDFMDSEYDQVHVRPDGPILDVQTAT